MNCLNCNTETTNPKFCSRHCSASYNNRTAPKRVRQVICRDCPDLVLAGYTYCSKCWKSRNKIDKTKNSNDGRNALVRSNSRKVYKKSGRPYSCFICGYAVHVDICHIKDIRSYPDGTSYLIVNSESNLIALCKNHHWEFDHDIL